METQSIDVERTCRGLVVCSLHRIQHRSLHFFDFLLSTLKQQVPNLTKDKALIARLKTPDQLLTSFLRYL